MRIGPVDQPDQPPRPAPHGLPSAGKREPLTPATPPVDSLQISAEGQRLAAASRPSDDEFQGAATGAVGRSEADRQSQIDRVRQRIESGFYDHREVIKEIARRLAEQMTKP